MARTAPRPQPGREEVLETAHRHCPACGGRLRYRYDNRHTVTTLAGLVRLRLRIRRCEDPGCARYRRPYRPEAEGALVLPQHEFGLDVIALVGALRYREHRGVPEIHRALLERGVAVCERTVTNLLDRYDELVATSLDDDDRLRAVLAGQGRVILALDGLQPDVGHEVLWVVRECLSGEVLLARSLLSSTGEDLAALLREVAAKVGVPVAGVISDGQHSVRRAVRLALPGVPHQLCQFHYLREAALPIFEADRHAKKELKKRVRGVRPVERSVEGRDDPEAEAVRGYCAAVRSAITDDGRPPLAASGLKLADRLEAVVASLDRVAEKGDDAAPAALAPAGRGRLGPHPRPLAGHPPRLRLGARRGPDPEQRGGPRRGRGRPPLRRARRRHRPPPRQGRRARRRRRPLPEGDPQLPARPVPRLRRRRPAAHRQRARAAVRVVPPPRAAGDRPQGQRLGDRAARPGAAPRRSGHPAAPPGRRRSGRRRSGALARGARQPRAPSARPRAAGAVPPRSRCLPQPARTAPPPASFADFEKTSSSRT